MDYLLYAGLVITLLALVSIVVYVSTKAGKLTFTTTQLEAVSKLWEIGLMSEDIYDFTNRTKIAYASGAFDKVNRESLQVLRDLQKRKTNILDKQQVKHITGEE